MKWDTVLSIIFTELYRDFTHNLLPSLGYFFEAFSGENYLNKIFWSRSRCSVQQTLTKKSNTSLNIRYKMFFLISFSKAKYFGSLFFFHDMLAIFVTMFILCVIDFVNSLFFSNHYFYGYLERFLSNFSWIVFIKHCTLSFRAEIRLYLCSILCFYVCMFVCVLYRFRKTSFKCTKLVLK